MIRNNYENEFLGHSGSAYQVQKTQILYTAVTKFLFRHKFSAIFVMKLRPYGVSYQFALRGHPYEYGIYGKHFIIKFL